MVIVYGLSFEEQYQFERLLEDCPAFEHCYARSVGLPLGMRSMNRDSPLSEMPIQLHKAHFRSHQVFRGKDPVLLNSIAEIRYAKSRVAVLPGPRIFSCPSPRDHSAPRRSPKPRVSSSHPDSDLNNRLCFLTPQRTKNTVKHIRRS